MLLSENEGFEGPDRDPGSSRTEFYSETKFHSYIDHFEVACAQCSSGVGPTYVRWGRTTCDAASTLVYKGRAAGSHHADAGSGHNLLCLHQTPKYGQNKTGESGTGARLYRAEYNTKLYGIPQMWALHGRDVPCAVCQSAASLASLMQSGGTRCPGRWHTAYAGYIMSSPINTRRSEYVCVDSSPTAYNNSDWATN